MDPQLDSLAIYNTDKDEVGVDLKPCHQIICQFQNYVKKLSPSNVATSTGIIEWNERTNRSQSTKPNKNLIFYSLGTINTN
jgi:hypothetical protein